MSSKREGMCEDRSLSSLSSFSSLLISHMMRPFLKAIVYANCFAFVLNIPFINDLSSIAYNMGSCKEQDAQSKAAGFNNTRVMFLPGPYADSTIHTMLFQGNNGSKSKENNSHQIQPTPPIIFFHGVGATIADDERPALCSFLRDQTGSDVYLFDYVRWGCSRANQSRSLSHEEVMISSGVSMVEFVLEKSASVILYGHSMGGAVVIGVLERHGLKGIQGVLLENTFSNFASSIIIYNFNNSSSRDPCSSPIHGSCILF